MGKYEVTNLQYCEFLNAKAKTDTYGLYNSNMGNSTHGGITRGGASGSYVYTLRSNMGDKPVNFVCRYDAVRFANWMSNGQGDGATETGAYTITAGGPNSGVVVAPVHGELAGGPLAFVLPTEDEWFKAAYYQGGSSTGGYWTYAIQSDSPHKEAHLDAEGNIDGYFNSGTSGEYTSPVGNAKVLNNYGRRLSTVGSAGMASQSHYGTLNQDDNVTELVEDFHSQNGTRQTVMGSSTFYGMEVHGWYFASLWQYSEYEDFGFRLAAVSIPEPAPFDLNLSMVRSAPYLDFNWNSRAGKLYRLWSHPDLSTPPPAGWTLVQDAVAPSPPSNLLQILAPADSRRFYVIEEYPAPHVVIVFETFDDEVTGWTSGVDGGSGTEWQLGTPANVGPPAASSPPACYGTNIDSSYGSDSNVWLRSPAIDLTSHSAGTVGFKEFIHIENDLINPDSDFGSLRIVAVDDGSTLGVLRARVEGNFGDWENFSTALPPAAFTEPFRVEFRLVTDDYDATGYAGWYIDDFSISAGGM